MEMPSVFRRVWAGGTPAQDPALDAESEMRFRGIFEHSSIAIATADPDGQVLTSVNPAYEELLGRSKDELLGRSWEEFTHPDDRERQSRRKAQAIARQDAHFTLEKRYVRKDGTVVWAETSIAWIYDPDGRPRMTIASAKDITDRKRAEEALQRSEEQYRRVVETSQDGIITTDLDGTITLANQRIVALLGYETADALLGKTAIELIVPDDRAAGRQGLRDLFKHGIVADVQCRLMRADGSSLPTEMTGSLLLDEASTPIGATAVIRDVTERAAYERRLQHLALHDVLTDLPNRALLEDRLQQALRSIARGRESVAVVLMDLNDFKEVNDTFGHQVGDQVLKHFAERVRVAIRESDTLARLGGDEFALVLPGVDETTAALVVSKLRETLEAPFESEGRRMHLVPSIGIALSSGGGMSAVELLRRADLAMYLAKASNSDFTIFQPEDDRRGAAQLELLADLHDAITNGDLFLHFQPKVDVRTGDLDGVEALVRWNHPERGMVPPNVFVELAERAGLIRPLTLTVLDQALQQCRRWQDDGFSIKVAVNLSAQSLHDPELDSMVAQRIERWGVCPHLLTLELTESAVMSNPDRAMVVLGRLRDMGVTLSIDDFGTGYSSLSYLKRLPVDEVKIDRSFVMDLLKDANSAPIVRSIIELSHTLGLHVVAEGVEDDETMRLLRGFGCDLAQGFGICRPVPAAGLEEWLSKAHTVREPGRLEAVRILAVDDDATYLKLVRTLLISEGFEVHTAANAEGAVAALKRMTPDLVLTDVNMPGMDGLELARVIRSTPEAERAVIVALTGKPEAEGERRARAIGCDFYAMKPESTRDLLALVRRHMPV